MKGTSQRLAEREGKRAANLVSAERQREWSGNWNGYAQTYILRWDWPLTTSYTGTRTYVLHCMFVCTWTEHKLREGAVHSKYSGLCMYIHVSGSELHFQREWQGRGRWRRRRRSRGARKKGCEERKQRRMQKITLVVGQLVVSLGFWWNPMHRTIPVSQKIIINIYFWACFAINDYTVLNLHELRFREKLS